MAGRTVFIELDEYKELIKDAHDFHILLDALYTHAGLDWSGKYLTFGSEKFSSIVEALDYETYQYALEQKKKEKQEETKDE